MPDKTPELLPCPFCGGSKLEIVHYLGGYRVKCLGCECESGYHSTEDKAMDAWNRRAQLKLEPEPGAAKTSEYEIFAYSDEHFNGYRAVTKHGQLQADGFGETPSEALDNLIGGLVGRVVHEHCPGCLPNGFCRHVPKLEGMK